MDKFTLSDKFRKRVKDNGGAEGFAERYGMKASVIEAYCDCEKPRQIQTGTLIFLAVVIDLQECPKCPRTTIEELKKAALSLVKEKAEFETEWDKMFE